MKTTADSCFQLCFKFQQKIDVFHLVTNACGDPARPKTSPRIFSSCLQSARSKTASKTCFETLLAELQEALTQLQWGTKQPCIHIHLSIISMRLRKNSLFEDPAETEKRILQLYTYAQSNLLLISPRLCLWILELGHFLSHGRRTTAWQHSDFALTKIYTRLYAVIETQ